MEIEEHDYISPLLVEFLIKEGLLVVYDEPFINQIRRLQQAVLNLNYDELHKIRKEFGMRCRIEDVKSIILGDETFNREKDMNYIFTKINDRLSVFNIRGVIFVDGQHSNKFVNYLRGTIPRQAILTEEDLFPYYIIHFNNRPSVLSDVEDRPWFSRVITKTYSKYSVHQLMLFYISSLNVWLRKIDIPFFVIANEIDAEIICQTNNTNFRKCEVLHNHNLNSFFNTDFFSVGDSITPTKSRAIEKLKEKLASEKKLKLQHINVTIKLTEKDKRIFHTTCWKKILSRMDVLRTLNAEFMIDSSGEYLVAK